MTNIFRKKIAFQIQSRRSDPWLLQSWQGELSRLKGKVNDIHYLAHKEEGKKLFQESNSVRAKRFFQLLSNLKICRFDFNNGKNHHLLPG
jgi:hypothetical protein